jgi:hypothetical protein
LRPAVFRFLKAGFILLCEVRKIDWFVGDYVTFIKNDFCSFNFIILIVSIIFRAAVKLPLKINHQIFACSCKMVSALTDLRVFMRCDVFIINLGEFRQRVLNNFYGLCFIFVLEIHPEINIAVFVHRADSVRTFKPKGVYKRQRLQCFV